MPQDVPDAVSPLAPFAGEAPVPGFEVKRRWMDGRDLTPAIRSQVLDLIEVAFNGAPSWFALPGDPADHFDWKYRDYPLGATPAFTVEPDGRVVGYIGRIRRVWFIHGRPYVARFGFDNCSHPDWQGRGLQRALEPGRPLEAHPAEDFVLGEYQHPVDRHLAVERGAREPANATQDYLRVLKPLSALRGRMRRLLDARRAPSSGRAGGASRTSARLRRVDRRRLDGVLLVGRLAARSARAVIARRPFRASERWLVSDLGRFEAAHAGAVAAAVGQFDFVGERSVEYLNWRFLDERAGPFRVRQVTRDGEFVGYAATRILGGRAVIADVLVRPDCVEAAEALIRDGVELAHEAGCSVVQTRLPKRHPYTGALERAGFVSLGHVAGEIADPQTPEDDYLDVIRSDQTSIHYVFADSDFA